MHDERISDVNRRMGMSAGDMRYSGMNMGVQNKGPMLVRNGNVIHNTGMTGNRMPQNSDVPKERQYADRGGGIGSLLGSIRLDEEKIVILLLIAILAGNGADLPLLAALGYLLL
ncbi:MAG: hypothetical protein IJ368_09230 [Oscillospiraceae bacterium]|nr:hypothetical protein [Oscillospiraceae bacterium]